MSQYAKTTEASENAEMIKLLREVSETLQLIATMQSNMEQRQCDQNADGHRCIEDGRAVDDGASMQA